MTATVVLVHGAFHGAWCWDRVVPRLEEQGVPVVAIDLPGHGADPAPPGDLYAHADALRAVLEGIDGPKVVVGHSYGGAPRRHARARLSPQNPATFAQPVRTAAWRTVPSTYVVCSEDRAVSVDFQRALATRTTSRVEMPTSHSPFFSAPEALANLFATIAREAAGDQTSR